ncbi:hypothetical protein GLOTRDRAFT_90316 [Gloeophyllum trabeum ATCC 11539]|uniref:Uncharacterized protein n=1 Tax=Gloeophyllum trabeum (strain ATCC 11539 / FP-39264 / Madison 617) TaxID=670483 RepID=S7QNB7_GLOTA|nr:uncharacterized protein GLOTRDRAFT_90316 [Gloeophyllum trabeum ATCC 11539]EPQ61006.1 hypothetical protein GLOTRDRAFT_90316 [Gloeophyllum trabeum ATCC 11539]
MIQPQGNPRKRAATFRLNVRKRERASPRQIYRAGRIDEQQAEDTGSAAGGRQSREPHDLAGVRRPLEPSAPSAPFIPVWSQTKAVDYAACHPPVGFKIQPQRGILGSGPVDNDYSGMLEILLFCPMVNFWLIDSLSIALEDIFWLLARVEGKRLKRLFFTPNGTWTGSGYLRLN